MSTATRRAPHGPAARAGNLAAAGEDELVRRAQDGDSAAFGELAGRHSSLLRRVLFRIAKDCEQAWDAMQEALLRAWNNIGRFERRSKFSTWLTRIGINELYSELRRARPETVELDDSVGERVPDWGAGTDRAVESQEFLAAIERGLEQLPVHYREAVILRDVEGFSTREAAAIVGVGERSFKSRLHRGRMSLRSGLDQFFEEGYVR